MEFVKEMINELIKRIDRDTKLKNYLLDYCLKEEKLKTPKQK